MRTAWGLVAHLRHSNLRSSQLLHNTLPSAFFSTTAEGQQHGQQLHHVDGLPLAHLPAGSTSLWHRHPSNSLIRLPGTSSALLGSQQSRGFCQGTDSDGDEGYGSDEFKLDPLGPELLNADHYRPKFRDPNMDAQKANFSMAYNIELGMQHRQLQDRSALEDLVREKFKMDLWDNVLVDVKRTVKVTKSAKVETFHAIVATGNHGGMFGVGEGADSNVQRAVSAAFFKSYANIVNVPLYRGHTIYHRIEHKRHTTNILMIPREFGKGIRASNLMYELCVLAGIQDITVQVRPRAGSGRCCCARLLRMHIRHACHWHGHCVCEPAMTGKM